MRYHKIPDETIKRLPRYMRALLLLIKEGRETVSSGKFAELLRANPPQIRKDLSYFGAFGTPGVGYDTKRLFGQIQAILGLDSTPKAALVGLGNLGTALLKYPGFKAYGMHITAIFDSNPEKIGETVGDIKVENVLELSTLKGRNMSLGIITVPAPAAQEIADQLIAAGVNGILNFAPYYLKVPEHVKVITIDIAMELARLTYYLPTKT